VDHGIRGEPELSGHSHVVESVMVYRHPVRHHSPGREAARLIECPGAMVVPADPERQQLSPEALRCVDQRVDHQAAQPETTCTRMDHDLGQLHDVTDRAFAPGLPTANGLHLAVNPAQGKPGTFSRHGFVPSTQPSADVGERWCLQPADGASELHHSAHHPMDLEGGLIIDLTEPLHAGIQF